MRRRPGTSSSSSLSNETCFAGNGLANLVRRPGASTGRTIGVVSFLGLEGTIGGKVRFVEFVVVFELDAEEVGPAEDASLLPKL